MANANSTSKTSKLFSIGILAISLLTGSVFGQVATTSQKKETANKADQNLKSISRVNPSTLAMEMSVPMMNYPGRNGNSLPVGISYSSKIWRMTEGATYWYPLPYSCARQYVSQIRPVFAERSAAGWTSSVDFPVIEERFQLYNENGGPFSIGLDEDNFNSFVQNSITEAASHAGSQNLLYACGSSCGEWGKVCVDGNCGPWTCTGGWETTYCESGTGGGGGCNSGGGPPPPPAPRYNVKRVQVRMGDGATHEFRKSDAIFEGSDPDNLGIFLAVDGSGMKLDRTTTGNTLYLPNGGRFLFPAISTGSFDRAALYKATDFIDADGNKSTFLKSGEGDLTVSKITDTLRREIANPLAQEKQVENKQKVILPSMDGREPQKYDLDWQHLKPVPCDVNTTTNCGNPEGAMENQNQNAFYYTSQTCFGSSYRNLLANPNNVGDPANEVMFPANGFGIRSCNPFSGETPAAAVGIRFNPVVLGGVTLPNGEKYTFKYNQFGEITKIIYPTGSYETFRYARIPQLSGTNELAYDQTNRGVVERKVYKADATLTERWQYAAETTPYPNIDYKLTTIASKGDNVLVNGIKTEKILWFSGLDESSYGFNEPRAGMPKEEKAYDENGAMRSRTLTEWIVAPPRPGINASGTRDPRVQRSVSVMIEGGQALATLSEMEYDEAGSSDAEYFSHLNVKRAKNYHYAVVPLNVAQTGTLAQIAGYFNAGLLANIAETDYQYDADYKVRGIAALPTESRVLDKNGNLISKTQTVYDETAALVNDSGTLTGDLANTWTSPNTTLRGKPTTGRLWDSDHNSWIETRMQYDQYGNARKIWEANELRTSNRFVETEYSADYGFAYPTKVITPAPDPSGNFGSDQGSFATTIYDPKTGLPLSATNEFGQTTATEYNDLLLRPTRSYAVNFAAPETQTIYDDDARTVKVRQQSDAANWNEATTFMDSFGRTVKTQAKDAQGDVFTETEYDLLGRVKRSTNPYRAGETKLWSRPRYDELGRAVESFAPAIGEQTGDSLGITQYEISTQAGFVGTLVTTTDAAGRKGRSLTNALGQLIRVDEPDSNNGLNGIPQASPTPTPTPGPTPPQEPPCSGNALPNPGPCSLAGSDYPSYSTFYKYNVQGKLIEVTQGDPNQPGQPMQKRYFLYDSLGRLIRVRQPEQQVVAVLDKTDAATGNNQWTAGFTYDYFGNVLTATDARGVTMTNTYDRANRVLTKTYSGEQAGQQTPPVYFTYDGKYYGAQGQPFQATGRAKGSLTQVRNGISTSQTTKYDTLGRAVEYEQITDGATYTSKYAYNFAGALIEETYPDGRVVKNEFNPDGDLLRVYGKANAAASEKTYVNSLSYTAAGGISQMRLGNGRWETAKFNTRLQMTELGLGNSGTDASLWKLNFEYGELNADGTTVNQTKNTGNIARQTISFAGLTNSFVESYRYDSLYRLTAASETNVGAGQANWTQNFAYDRFGNRTAFAQTGAGIPTTATPTVDAATNRFNTGQGIGYDKNGNIITDTVGTQNRNFTFNGDNKQTEVRDPNITPTPGNPDANLIGRYAYDGEGKRVKKETATETTIFVYSSGKLIQEYSTKLADQPSINYTTSDHLGTPRIITDELGAVKARRDFMPFGEELLAGVGGRTSDTGQKYSATKDEVRQKFTGYQKDAETQLDFAEARMYNNSHGRFTAVDPLLASGNSANPQTFNRYVYVGNNPIILTDPTGLFGDYYSRGGKWLANDGINDGKVYFADHHHTDETGVYAVTGSIEPTTWAAVRHINGWYNPSPPSRTPSFLDSFPTNPWEQVATGAAKGVGNVGIGAINFATWATYNLGRAHPNLENPWAIHPFSLNTQIERNFGYGFEGASVLAAPVAAAPFRAGSAFSVVPRGSLQILAENPSASELRAATYMKNKGFDTILRDPVGTRAGGGTSDILADGIRFDVYTPTTSNPNRIIGAIAGKNNQATGIILDLTRTSVTRSQLGNVLGRVRGAGANNITDIHIIRGY